MLQNVCERLACLTLVPTLLQVIAPYPAVRKGLLTPLS